MIEFYREADSGEYKLCICQFRKNRESIQTFLGFSVNVGKGI